MPPATPMHHTCIKAHQHTQCKISCLTHLIRRLRRSIHKIHLCKFCKLRDHRPMCRADHTPRPLHRHLPQLPVGFVTEVDSILPSTNTLRVSRLSPLRLPQPWSLAAIPDPLRWAAVPSRTASPRRTVSPCRCTHNRSPLQASRLRRAAPPPPPPSPPCYPMPLPPSGRPSLPSTVALVKTQMVEELRIDKCTTTRQATR